MDITARATAALAKLDTTEWTTGQKAAFVRKYVNDAQKAAGKGKRPNR